LIAKFHGTLDIKTLGGAGFASQRTRGEDRTWDLSAYDGIELIIDSADGKLYTLTLKDEILPKRPDGREQSTISWEFDFRAEGRRTIFVKWSDFRATYRGKNRDDAEPLDLKRIKRFGIMIRRYVLNHFARLGLAGIDFRFLVSSETKKALLRLTLFLLRHCARSDTLTNPMISPLTNFCMRNRQPRLLLQSKSENVEGGSAG
jgi:hypothetical protein